MPVAEPAQPEEVRHPPAKRSRRGRYIAAAVFAALAITFIVRFNQQRRLTPTERRLVGAWEWQDKPGVMVLYFDEERILTYSTPPFTTFQFERWRIDGNQRIHFEMEGGGLSGTVGRMLGIQADVYDIRFEDGTAVLTGDNGTKQVLVPYTGNATQMLKDAR